MYIVLGLLAIAAFGVLFNSLLILQFSNHTYPFDAIDSICPHANGLVARHQMSPLGDGLAFFLLILMRSLGYDLRVL
jgi:hypothetical protein